MLMHACMLAVSIDMTSAKSTQHRLPTTLQHPTHQILALLVGCSWIGTYSLL